MDQAAVEAYLQRTRAEGDASMRPCSLVSPELLPIPAQRVGIAHLFLRPGFLLADPTGSGKTPMAVAGFAYLREKDPGLKALVLTTKSAQFQWKASLNRFLPGLDVEVIGYNGNSRKTSPALRTARYYNEARTADVWVTTNATTALDQEHILLNLDNYILILDEAHHLSNHKQSKIYPAVQRVAQKARARWALSATPVDWVDDIYSLMELVRPGTFPSYSVFRRTYFVLRLVKPRWKAKPGKPAPKPFYEVLGTQNLDHLRAVVDPFYLRRPFEVFSDKLPTLTFRREDVELEPAQRKLYDDVWVWPGKDGGKILKIAAITKAQQALGAPSILGRDDVPSAKQETLLRLLQTELRDRKVVVYSKFAAVVEVLHRALTTAGIAHGQVTGEVDLKTREATRVRFQTAPDFNVVLITDAGGEALDLQAAGVVVFYDLPWNDSTFKQTVGRVRRFGSAHANVLAILLVATRSFDEPILQQLLKKETQIRDLLRQGNASTDVTLTSTFSSTEITFTDMDIIDQILG